MNKLPHSTHNLASRCFFTMRSYAKGAKTVVFVALILILGEHGYTTIQRYYVRETIAQTAFPYFHETKWWEVRISSSGMFGIANTYEAKFILLPESIDNIIKNDYERFDLALASRSITAADSPSTIKQWHDQHRLFGGLPQIGTKIPGQHYRPASQIDFVNDEIYYRLSNVGSPNMYSVIINASRNLAWVYIGPI